MCSIHLFFFGITFFICFECLQYVKMQILTSIILYFFVLKKLGFLTFLAYKA